jgi:hypothetical protein
MTPGGFADFFKRLFGLLVVAGVSLEATLISENAACATLVGTVVQDQYHPGSNGGYAGAFPFLERAQVFPITVDGYLDHIDVYVNRSSSSAGNLLWDVRPLNNGEPVESDSLALASGSIPLNVTPLFPDLPGTTLDVSQSLIRVRPGDRLAVTLRTDVDSIAWRVHFSGNPGAKFDRLMSSYNGGTDMWEPDNFFPARAHGFATYVRTIPEPASFLSGLSGLMLVCARWRADRKGQTVSG